MKDCNEQMKGFERSEVRMSEDDRADIYSKAKTNRDRLKNGLARNESPKSIGSRTQGSYAMRTMIQHDRGDYDVDDGVYFSRESLKNDKDEDKSPEDARKMVSDALQDDRFADQPEARNNCVRVYYKTRGYHVDVPVYRENRTKNPFTGEEAKSYEIAAGDKWRASDPLANTKWFKDENRNRSSDATANGNDGQFVRVVRLAKGFARSRYGWSDKIASGFAISKLVADHFSEVQSRDDQVLRQTLRSVSLVLALNSAVRHPVLNENIAESGDEKTKFFKEKIDESLKHLDVLDKLDCSHEEAMKAWDKFFNTDWFSKQPDPAKKSQAEKASGPAVIKQGESRYA
ncbi:nucleotidyltransferase domain-containing protein [Bradyrhizobium zhanjiangense]|uniref:Cyclic GMP-AMP synthase n=1 Tax=Bradyrhizobium zhanjiangense TaxID=1325107 RepID=A0A4Q0Q8N3_9BRAD|nr:nucleotidyltransferase [Bradyrhizobium zhanjiangense]RXG85685.1 nucleotidyltransferase [Bradyrhizobium zhanjiangense]